MVLRTQRPLQHKAPGPAHARRDGQQAIHRAATVEINLELTRTGKRLLNHAKHVRLTARGTFTLTGNTAIAASTTYELTR